MRRTVALSVLILAAVALSSCSYAMAGLGPPPTPDASPLYSIEFRLAPVTGQAAECHEGESVIGGSYLITSISPNRNLTFNGPVEIDTGSGETVEGWNVLSFAGPLPDIAAICMASPGPGIIASGPVWRTETVALPAVGSFGIAAACDEGEVVVGGGYSFNSEGLDRVVTANRPLEADNDAGPSLQAWHVQANVDASVGPELTVTAICIEPGPQAPENGGLYWRTVHGTVTEHSGVYADCDGHGLVVDGGYIIGSPGLNHAILYNGEFGQRTWGMQAFVQPPIVAPTAVTAICQGPAPGWDLTWGDNDCRGGAGAADSLLPLRFLAGLGTDTGPCPNIGQVIDVADASLHLWGDVDCSGEVTAADSLKLLLHDAGLTVPSESGCPDIGDEIDSDFI